MMLTWRTRVDPDRTRRYGVDELHIGVFEHADDHGGPSRIVTIQVPEASRAMFKEALRVACRSKARILVVCDTSDQVDQAVVRITRRCRHHRRVALERANAGGFGPTQ